MKDYLNPESRTVWLALINLVLAALVVILPLAGAPATGLALGSFMKSPEYIAGMGSLVTITMRAAIGREK